MANPHKVSAAVEYSWAALAFGRDPAKQEKGLLTETGAEGALSLGGDEAKIEKESADISTDNALQQESDDTQEEREGERVRPAGSSGRVSKANPYRANGR